MRAREPDVSGTVAAGDGVRIAYETFGSGEPTVVLLPSAPTCQPLARATCLAELTGDSLVVVDGADHMIPGRHPVLANLLIRDFVRSVSEGQPW